MSEISEIYDDGESYCTGDIDPADVDWDQVAELQRRQAAALDQPEGPERSLAMAELLTEMYGDDLEVL